MAEPIKTTVQDAFDHIKQWIAEGSKDKAIQGLNEILSFDPANADAKKMLEELQVAATTMSAPASAPAAAPIMTPPPASTPSPAPIAPAPAPVLPIATPASAPIAAAEEPIPPPIEPSVQLVNEEVQGMSKNVKMAILIGGIVLALIAGFFFYKTFLSPVKEVAEDIRKQAEQTPPATIVPVQTETSTPSQTETFPTEASNSSPESSSNSISVPSENSASIQAEGEKVKRR